MGEQKFESLVSESNCFLIRIIIYMFESLVSE